MSVESSSKPLKVLDLFSGIGGFSLGLERAGMKTVAFCEIDPFCRKVLRKNWPDTGVFPDISQLRAVTPFKGLVLDGHNSRRNQAHWPREQEQWIGPIDLICGGFPCQETSLAAAPNGEREGLGGDRSGLWFEMLRLVQEVRPAWVIVENVPGVRTWKGAIVDGLESAGFGVSLQERSSRGVGAPHERRRMFFIAHTSASRLEAFEQILHQRNGEVSKGPIVRPPADSIGVQATSRIDRVDDGFSGRVDAARLKALGNAVDPRVVAEIGRGILASYEVSEAA